MLPLSLSLNGVINHTRVFYLYSYADHEQTAQCYPEAKAIFEGNCLFDAVNVALIQTYLENVNSMNEGQSNHREKMLQAYKFALDSKGDKGVGLDYTSTPIWKGYIDFLKADKEVLTAEASKIGEVRKAYRQAIASPKQGIEGTIHYPTGIYLNREVTVMGEGHSTAPSVTGSALQPISGPLGIREQGT